MIVGKKIVFDFKYGVDDALVAIADEIKNGYTVKNIFVEEPRISCCADTNQRELWVAELVNTNCSRSEK